MNAIIFSAIWGVVMMFSSAFLKNKNAIRLLAITGAALLLALNILELYQASQGVHFLSIDTKGMLAFETFGMLANTVAFASTLLFLLFSAKDIEEVGPNSGDYFALIFFVLCGVALVTSYNNLLMLFIGIEVLSIPLYILTGSSKRNLKGNEAALKYFLMGSFSTGLMLLGIAFLYGASPTGSFFIDDIGIGHGPVSPLFVVGLLLLIAALSFKVSAAPFHFWTPDVYDGAPTPFTSFMATVVKGAAFIAFIRLFADSFGEAQAQWQLIIAIIAAATLFIGNITAVFQQSVKRMLAYSSIAQVGFMLLAILSLKQIAQDGIILYIAAYSLATIGIFAVLGRLKDQTYEGFNGLAKQHPVLAFVSTIFLLSLAGIPLTAGFFAKYYMLTALLQTGKFLWLAIFAVLCAAVSVYYYFRVIQAMYFKEGVEQEIDASAGFKNLLIIDVILIILLGIFPQVLINALSILYL
ncbi:MAG: NADH-quinone oxidoreductase subunit N [Bacteroidetes bacterium]|nr:NADH-quinone oxidoreductase subunit N [Bacteroidota bacterium]